MMVATQLGIGEWFRQAPTGATHMVIVCDEISWSDFPVYVMPGEDPRAVVEQNTVALQKVMEVYHLGYDLDKQLMAKRVWNYEMPLDGYGDRVLRLMGEISPEELKEGVKTWTGKLAEVAQAELDRRGAVAAATVVKEQEAKREELRRASRVVTG